VDVYGEDFGLPNDWKYPFLFNNKIVIGNHSGLFELQKDRKADYLKQLIFLQIETASKKLFFHKRLKRQNTRNY
jgi:hypothetical protein